ncbi:MAG TPA: radical SAM protein [Elusimicrobiota bacterium]|nr:radical SAM protein [Elusimicrobiota bacterium]
MDRLLIVWENPYNFSRNVESIRQTVRAHPETGRTWRVDDFNLKQYGFPNDPRSLIEEILRIRPAVVAFLYGSVDYAGLAVMAQTIAKALPESLLLALGKNVANIRLSVNLLTRYPDLDAIVRDEPESVLPSLLVQWNRASRLDGIAGVTHRTDTGTITVEKPRPPVSPLDRIPTILGSGRYDSRKATETRAAFGKLIINLETSRGCRQRCGFCQHNNLGQRIRLFSLGHMEEEIREACALPSDGILFMDTHFGVTKPRAIQLLEMIVRHNRTPRRRVTLFPDPLHVDDRYIELMKRGHCRPWPLGIQTTREETLRLAGRRPYWKQFLRAAGLLKKAFPEDIGVDLMYGLPGDDYTSFMKSIDEIYDAYLPRIYTRIFSLAPQSLYYDRQEEYGIRTAPDGTVVSTNTFSEEDMKKADRLHGAQHVLFHFLEGAVYFLTQNLNVSYTGLLEGFIHHFSTIGLLPQLHVHSPLTSNDFFTAFRPWAVSEFESKKRHSLIPLLEDMFQLLQTKKALLERPWETSQGPEEKRVIVPLSATDHKIEVSSHDMILSTRFDVIPYIDGWIDSRSAACAAPPKLRRTSYLIHRTERNHAAVYPLSEKDLAGLKNMPSEKTAP